MRRCTRCVMPETQETSTYNEDGVCNVCLQQVFKKEKIDWEQKKKDLLGLVDTYRDKYEYDCIVPFSGGKDSTFTLWYLVKELKLKPLVVCFDHGFLRPNLKENTIRTIKKLGVDYLQFRPNWHVVKKLMMEALKRKGDFCWHCHTGIFSYPMHLAIKFNVPLIIWGEPSAEYISYYGYDEVEEVDEKRFNRYINLGITAQDMIGFIDGVSERDLMPFTYPKLKDLKKIKYRSICLGSFIPWDVKKQVKIIQEDLGWKGDKVEGVPPGYEYEKIECQFQGIRDYLKWIKRGWARPSHLASIDIRNGRLTREEGMELINKYEGERPASLDLFLEFLDLTEEEFMKIATSHVVDPHKFDPSMVKKGEPLPDMNKWDKTK